MGTKMSPPCLCCFYQMFFKLAGNVNTHKIWDEFELKDLKLRFHTALTTNDVKFRFRISALPWLPIMWHELRSALLLCQFFRRCEVPLLHFRPALSAKDMKFNFRTSALLGLKLCFHTSALPWLAKMWNSAFQTSVLSELRKISSSASALFRPGLPKTRRSTSAFHLCRDFQRCEVPLPHFCSALTVKDLKFDLPAYTLL